MVKLLFERHMSATKTEKADTVGPVLARVDHVAIVGTGAMGAQIACVCALAGYKVTLVGRSQERLTHAHDTIDALVARRVEKGALSSEQGQSSRQALVYSDDLAGAVQNAGLVIESVAEDRAIKAEILHQISEHAPGDAVIGTNSSTIGSSTFADVVQNPSRLLNVHFFNPPMIMKLVEVVRGPHTSDDAVNRASEFARSLGKAPVVLQKEEFGFIANRLLFAAIAEALRLVERGCVSVEDCDLAVRHALGWQIGPFAVADLVGLDVVVCILDEGVRQTGDGNWQPSEQLRELVGRGELGRKTKKGFAVY